MKTLLIYLIPLFSLAITSLILYSGNYHFVLIILWVISLISISLYCLPRIPFHKTNHPAGFLLILILINTPAIIRIIFFNTQRIHQDDLIAAYLSIKTNFTQANFFAGIPTDKADWAGQFPSLFFALQKLFFNLCGETIYCIKLSTIPYTLLISLALFLIAHKLFDRTTATITLIIYAFFPLSLYLETMGFHFISSTAAFIILFYLLLLWFNKPSEKLSLAVGLVCGLNYLFYMTSYIAIPYLFLIYTLKFIKTRQTLILKFLFLSLFTFLVTLGPFLTFGLRYNNYFTSRMGNVYLLSEEQEVTPPFTRLRDNFKNSVKSFYQDNIGGHGGYNYGFQAFFDEFTLYLFVLGTLIAILLSFKRFELLFVIVVILISFPAMFLSVPPPAYHRLSLTFPFISLILSVPFYSITKITKLKLFTGILLLTLLAFYIINSYEKFHLAVAVEDNYEPLKLANFINEKYPGRKIYVAAYPGLAFEKIYYFSKGKNALSIKTDYHDNILPGFNPHEKYLYVIIFPNEFKDKFTSLDKQGKIIYSSKDYALFAN